MPIESITIVIKQGKGTDGFRENRVLEFDGNSKKWKEKSGDGLFPSECKLISEIDLARQHNTV